MNPMLSIPVKVLVGEDMHPGKKELDFFMQKWKSEGRGIPFQGEYNAPKTNDPQRLLTTDPSQIAVTVFDVHMNTFDDQKSTVMMDLRFTGPRGAEAYDEYIKGKLRFMTRAVKVTDHGKSVNRIVTFDCIHAPKGSRVKKPK